jgi:drug/metabolite transporter, DME family
MSDRAKGILLCTLGVLLWSTGGLCIKLLPQDAETILFYRSLYTSIFFIIFFREKLFKINKKSFLTSLGYAPLMLCFVSATKMTTAANAIFLQSTGVAYVLLLEPVLLRTKLLRIDIITVIVCFLGMMLFLIDGFEISHNNPGIYVAMLSGIATAGVILGQKSNDIAFVPSGLVLGNIWVMLYTLPSFIESPYPSMYENSLLLFLGFIQLGVGYMLFIFGQNYLSAIESALISMLEPLFNPILVAVGYGEIPGWLPLIGGLIIVMALVWRTIMVDRAVRYKA